VDLNYMLRTEMQQQAHRLTAWYVTWPDGQQD